MAVEDHVEDPAERLHRATHRHNIGSPSTNSNRRAIRDGRAART